MKIELPLSDALHEPSFPADHHNLHTTVEAFRRDLRPADSLNEPYGWGYEAATTDTPDLDPADLSLGASVLWIYYVMPRKGRTRATGILLDGSERALVEALDAVAATVLPRLSKAWGPLLSATMTRLANVVDTLTAAGLTGEDGEE
jgi:hypothetical protein